jgi:dihydroorotate dehydrogenase
VIYRLIFRFLLARLDAERVHELALGLLGRIGRVRPLGALLGRVAGRPDESLRVEALGLRFSSPLGLAAGFDKDARAVRGLLSLGFGFVEVGTVTALPQPGNPRPRIFRLRSERALLNRMGFPNRGAAAAASRLRRRPAHGVVGVNVGRSKAAGDEGTLADYQASIATLAPLADYVVLNVSSPNTPGLRDLQAVDRLDALVRHAQAVCPPPRPPLLVKIAPDLSDEDVDGIADLVLWRGLEGIVAVNTTVDLGAVAGVDRLGPGGISGPPVRERSLAVLRRLRARVGGRVCLISVGGIETPEDAWARLRAGASLVQAYTGFVYGGPLWPRHMNRGLARLLRQSGARSIEEIVGVDAGPAERSAAAGDGPADRQAAAPRGASPVLPG